MSLLRRFVGFHILVLGVVGLMVFGGHWAIYLDLPTFVMMAGVLVGGAVVCFPLRQIQDAFLGAMFEEEARPVSASQKARRIAVFARLYQLAWGGGLVVALLSMIAMLSDLSDPASIGTGMAVALIAPAYGALLAEFFFNPLQQLVMNQDVADTDGPGDRDEEPLGVGSLPGGSGLWKGTTVVAVMIAVFLLPIVSFSEIKKEDALSPQQEATYIRYLYGDDAPQSQAVSPRLDVTRRQHELERRALIEKLRELHLSPEAEPSADERAGKEMQFGAIVDQICAIPMPEGINPAKSHLWRLHLLEQLELQADVAD